MLWVLFFSSGAAAASPREELSMDFGWRFFLGDPSGAEKTSFVDASWRGLDLPHDWSIEGKPDQNNPSGAGGGYFPTGVGWYRKTFAAPTSWKNRRISVEFDGVYRNATVYLNGQKLGIQPYGYTGFNFDLSPYLNYSGPNVLAVRVDNSEQPNSRWYSGSGIYRHVRMVVTAATHIARWGVFITTPEISDEEAKVSVRTKVENRSGAEGRESEVTVQTILIEPGGKRAGEIRSKLTANRGQESEISQELRVDKPVLWNPQSPRLYRAVTRIILAGKAIDEVVTSFGIRSLAWSAEKGFLLNGLPIEINGGSVHHDNGPLGAAAFDRAEERKAELLKKAGFNAVRTAHNIPSPAFLDASDRLGLLVLDEPFDVWGTGKVKYDYARNFDEWWQRDLDAMVLRDRNHPSIVMWGIGNEIAEVWTKEGAPLARKIAERVRSLDGTRPLIQAYPGATYGPNPDAAIAAVDIAGYNYNLAQNHLKDHERVPARLMLTTESFPADAFEQRRLVKDNLHIIGEFVWTAMDYLGESGIGAWQEAPPEKAAGAKNLGRMLPAIMANLGADGKNPFAITDKPMPPNPLFPGYPWHASYCGDLDLTGFRKPQSHYRDIIWNGGDRVYAAVRLPESEDRKIFAVGWAVYPSIESWTWTGLEGREMEVEVFSSADSVRLYLNDKLLGEKPTGLEQQYKSIFKVPYAPGTLRAVGVKGGREVAEHVLTTAGAAEGLRLSADRSALQADGQDLSFVTVEALDAQGRFQPNAAQEIEFTISGPGIIAAVGNGAGRGDDPYQGRHRKLFNGRAVVVVRTTRASGTINLTASAPGLKNTSLMLRTARPVTDRTEVR